MVRALAAPGRIVLPSPGFEAPARIVGKYGREVERRPMNSHKEGLVTDCGYIKPGGASEGRGVEGTCGNYPMSRDREAEPPVPSLP